MIGLGTEIRDVVEFNRRAAIALKAVEFGAFNSSQRVVDEYQRQYAAGSVSEKMQQAIYNIVNRYRRQVTDQMVVAYASLRAKGSD